jgi:hypothetical protein
MHRLVFVGRRVIEEQSGTHPHGEAQLLSGVNCSSSKTKLFSACQALYAGVPGLGGLLGGSPHIQCGMTRPLQAVTCRSIGAGAWASLHAKEGLQLRRPFGLVTSENLVEGELQLCSPLLAILF